MAGNAKSEEQELAISVQGPETRPGGTVVLLRRLQG
jgi:hypothetical protein